MMPLDPILEPFMVDYPETPAVVEDYPAFREASQVGTDALVAQVAEPGPQVGEVRERSIPVDGGRITLRIYRPASDGPLPIHLYFHGGGFVIGSVFDLVVDITCRERAALAGQVVVAVDYRLAPEYPFPTAVDDAFTALRWVAEHAAEIGGRADRISVGGGSAGGNIAAALALKTRDEGGPALALQLLEVPILDFDFSRPSHAQFGAGYALSTWDVEFARRSYTPDEADRANSYASPLVAPDLHGLAPAVILSAEFDVLRDDGAAYAERLQRAGVPARFSLQAGQVHVSSAVTAISPAARSWREEVLEALRRVAEQ